MPTDPQYPIPLFCGKTTSILCLFNIAIWKHGHLQRITFTYQKLWCSIDFPVFSYHFPALLLVFPMFCWVYHAISPRFATFNDRVTGFKCPQKTRRIVAQRGGQISNMAGWKINLFSGWWWLEHEFYFSIHSPAKICLVGGFKHFFSMSYMG